MEGIPADGKMSRDAYIKDTKIFYDVLAHYLTTPQGAGLRRLYAPHLHAHFARARCDTSIHSSSLCPCASHTGTHLCNPPVDERFAKNSYFAPYPWYEAFTEWIENLPDDKVFTDKSFTLDKRRTLANGTPQTLVLMILILNPSSLFLRRHSITSLPTTGEGQNANDKP